MYHLVPLDPRHHGSIVLQVIAQVERNDAYLMADFLTKRGQHPVVGATHSPPRDFNYDNCSAVLGCFCKTLAIAKVSVHAVMTAAQLYWAVSSAQHTTVSLGAYMTTPNV